MKFIFGRLVGLLRREPPQWLLSWHQQACSSGTILGGFLNISNSYFCRRRVVSTTQKLLQNCTHLFDRTPRLAPSRALVPCHTSQVSHYLAQYRLRLSRSLSGRTGHINSPDSMGDFCRKERKAAELPCRPCQKLNPLNYLPSASVAPHSRPPAEFE